MDGGDGMYVCVQSAAFVIPLLPPRQHMGVSEQTVKRLHDVAKRDLSQSKRTLAKGPPPPSPPRPSLIFILTT